MRLRRSLAIARHELRILRRDPFTFVVLVAMPLVLIAFGKPMMRFVVAGQGYENANGAEHAVPGMAVMFAFFFVGNVGFSFFREYGWNTWERLRASRATPLEIMAGKVAPLLVVAVGQQVAVLAIGGALFGLRVEGPLLALAVVALALGVCLVSFGVAVVSVSKTINQVNLVQTLGTMLFAGLGGALTPPQMLPAWVRPISPATPSYWALRGYRSVILDGGGVAEVLLPCAVLLGFATGFAVVATMRFRFEETKVSWA